MFLPQIIFLEFLSFLRARIWSFLLSKKFISSIWHCIIYFSHFIYLTTKLNVFSFFSVKPWYPGERGTCNKKTEQKHILDWLSVTQRIRKKTNHHIVTRNIKNEFITLPDQCGLMCRESEHSVYNVDPNDIRSAMNCYPHDIVNNNSFSDCFE